MRRLQRLVVFVLALLLSAPGGPLLAGDGAVAPPGAWTAGESCPDCGEGCPPGQMVRSGCMGMCAVAPAERFAAIAPAEAEAQHRAPLDELGLGGLRLRPEPTPPRLRA